MFLLRILLNINFDQKFGALEFGLTFVLPNMMLFLFLQDF
jgi:hypothetical protein